MTREDKKKIERRAYWHDLLRQLRGPPDFPVKLFFHALFLVGAVYVATKQAILREQVKHIELISPILKAAMEHAVCLSYHAERQSYLRNRRLYYLYLSRLSSNGYLGIYDARGTQVG